MLFYVFAYKSTNKPRISLTFPEEKTKNERKAAAFEQKSIPHPYINVRMGDVHLHNPWSKIFLFINNSSNYPIQAVHLVFHREVQANLHHLLAAHLESVGIVFCLYLG